MVVRNWKAEDAFARFVADNQLVVAFGAVCVVLYNLGPFARFVVRVLS